MAAKKSIPFLPQDLHYAAFVSYLTYPGNKQKILNMKRHNYKIKAIHRDREEKSVQCNSHGEGILPKEEAKLRSKSHRKSHSEKAFFFNCFVDDDDDEIK